MEIPLKGFGIHPMLMFDCQEVNLKHLLSDLLRLLVPCLTGGEFFSCFSLFRLSFSQVVLPPVPLSIRSELTFLLINEGYDQLEVKYRLPADKARIPLELEFPEGCMVSRAKKQIPVKVCHCV